MIVQKKYNTTTKIENMIITIKYQINYSFFRALYSNLKMELGNCISRCKSTLCQCSFHKSTILLRSIQIRQTILNFELREFIIFISLLMRQHFIVTHTVVAVCCVYMLIFGGYKFSVCDHFTLEYGKGNPSIIDWCNNFQQYYSNQQVTHSVTLNKHFDENDMNE